MTLLVTDVLDRLGVPYFIGGSLASTVHGAPRTTLDTDIVADLEQRHVSSFLGELGPAFYSDEQTVREAIGARRSFNLIHIATAFKVDVFIPPRRPFERQQMKRRSRHTVVSSPTLTLYITTPEDIILAKLDWYRQGGMASERQWSDVLGVIAAQGARLDQVYLRQWAERLQVADLLDRALTAARS